jgi:predicted nucleic acid-binding Zn ribbon protein
MLEYEAVERWSEIVGEHIALNAEAAKIVKGVLTVRTTSAVWRNELHLCKAELIEKINSALGSEIVKDIKFR